MRQLSDESRSLGSVNHEGAMFLGAVVLYVLIFVRVLQPNTKLMHLEICS